MSDTEGQLKEILDHVRKIERAQDADRLRSEEWRKQHGARLSAVENKLSAVSDMANRWKGAFAAILGAGGLLGFLISQWENIKGFFRG